MTITAQAPRKPRRLELRLRRQLAHAEARAGRAGSPTAHLQAQVDLLRSVIKNADEATATHLSNEAARYIAGLVATHRAPRSGRRNR